MSGHRNNKCTNGTEAGQTGNQRLWCPQRPAPPHEAGPGSEPGAGLQLDEPSWTLCLQHWCSVLTLSHSWWTEFTWCSTVNMKMQPTSLLVTETWSACWSHWWTLSTLSSRLREVIHTLKHGCRSQGGRGGHVPLISEKHELSPQ